MKWASKLVALSAAIALPLVSAAADNSSSSGNNGSPKPDKDGKYWIYGDDISAAFIPYGASISNFMMKDQYGIERDLVAGFDNASYYSIDKQHPHFGGVPGRYANRIKNSSFEIDGHTYHITPNENFTPDHPEGVDTLHGGPDGWDWRNFTVVAHSNNSITFSIVDPDGKEGFPGEVVSFITYTLTGNDWDLKMVALATTKKTPIMLSSHVYWNLDGFANNETNKIFNHTLHMPYAGERMDVDNILIPKGGFLANEKGSVNDFWSKPKQVGSSFGDKELKNNCGFNCTGYDNCFINNRGALGPYDWRKEGPVTTLSSNWSGIQLDVFTDQDAFQVYSCGGQNGSMALKKTQGLHPPGNDKRADGNSKNFPRTIPQYGCLVLEVQDYIDGINNPQWMRGPKQIFEPGGDPYILQAKYRFSHLSDHDKSKCKSSS